MRWLFFLLVLLVLVGCAENAEKIEEKPSEPPFKGESMKLLSPDFEDNGFIPVEFTCDGEDVSPELKWSGVPENAKSLVLRCYDPDAPHGWLHWLVVNIPPDVEGFPRGVDASSFGVEVLNDFGKTSYGGPCPPSGTHRYVFTLFALDTTLEGVTKDNFFDKIEGHVLSQSVLTGLYSRKR